MTLGFSPLGTFRRCHIKNDAIIWNLNIVHIYSLIAGSNVFPWAGNAQSKYGTKMVTFVGNRIKHFFLNFAFLHIFTDKLMDINE